MIEKKKKYKLSDFKYALPKSLLHKNQSKSEKLQS